MQEICQQIEGHTSFLLLSHHGPDGDGLGAMFALFWGLRSLGKEVVVASSAQPPAVYTCIPGIDDLSKNPRLDGAHRIITLDAGDARRVEYYDTAYQSRTITIDHHASNTGFGAWNWLELEVSSTSEMVAWLLCALNVNITADIANSLLVGIYFDTGNLQHNVYPSTFEIVGKLMQKGGDMHQIRHLLTHTKSAAVLKIWGTALSSVYVLDRSHVAFTVLDKADLKQASLPYQEMALDQLSNYLSTIQESQASLLLTERKPSEWKGSLRSENFKGVDVQAMAQLFGGGGHVRASGFKHRGSVDEVLQMINSAS